MRRIKIIHSRLVRFISQNLMGMVLFAVFTGILGTVIYDYFSEDTGTSGEAVVANNKTPLDSEPFESSIDAIITSLRRGDSSVDVTAERRQVIRNQFEEIVQGVRVAQVTESQSKEILKPLSTGDIAATERVIIQHMETSAKRSDFTQASALATALLGLNQIEDDVQKISATEKLIVAFSSAPAQLPPSIARATFGSSGAPAIDIPFSISSQSDTYFETSEPWLTIVIGFSGNNLDRIRELSMEAVSAGPGELCAPFSAHRTRGGRDWQRNFLMQSATRLNIKITTVIPSDPLGMCRWTLTFSDDLSATSESFLVRRN